MQDISYQNIVNEGSTVTVERFLQRARSYTGTPYQTQGRSRAGVDCGGYLLVLGWDLDLTDLQVLGYSNQPDGETFERLLHAALVEVSKSETRPGDILACDYGKGIQHTAVVTAVEPRLTVIHAKRQHGVTEHGLHGRDRRGWVKTFRMRHLMK